MIIAFIIFLNIIKHNIIFYAYYAYAFYVILCFYYAYAYFILFNIYILILYYNILKYYIIAFIKYYCGNTTLLPLLSTILLHNTTLNSTTAIKLLKLLEYKNI